MANYLNVPTASGASTPDQAGLAAGTGSVDLRAELAPTSWASGAFQAIVNQYTSSGGAGTRFWFGISPSGTLEYDFYNSVPSTISPISTVATGLSGGVSKGVRVLHNIAAGTADFYTSPDFTTWTPLGTQITGLATTGMATTGTPPIVRIGTDAAFEHCPGQITKTLVIIGGSTILNMGSPKMS